MWHKNNTQLLAFITYISRWSRIYGKCVSASREYMLLLKVFIFWKYQRTREPTTKILINVLLSPFFNMKMHQSFSYFFFTFAGKKEKEKKVQTWPQNEGFLDGFTGCQTFYSSFCETIIKQNGVPPLHLVLIRKPCIID